MREHLSQADMDCEEALEVALDAIVTPPYDTAGINQVRGDLAQKIWHLDREVEGIGNIAGDLLKPYYQPVQDNHLEVVALLYQITAATESPSFVEGVGKMIKPLRELLVAIRAMEAARFEGSNMRRSK